MKVHLSELSPSEPAIRSMGAGSLQLLCLQICHRFMSQPCPTQDGGGWWGWTVYLLLTEHSRETGADSSCPVQLLWQAVSVWDPCQPGQDSKSCAAMRLPISHPLIPLSFCKSHVCTAAESLLCPFLLTCPTLLKTPGDSKGVFTKR